MWSMKSGVLVVAALLVCLGGTAGAATVQVNVPFSFQLHGQMLPAGQYLVTSDGNGVVEIEGVRGTRVGMAWTLCQISGQVQARYADEPRRCAGRLSTRARDRSRSRLRASFLHTAPGRSRAVTRRGRQACRAHRPARRGAGELRGSRSCHALLRIAGGVRCSTRACDGA